MPCLHNSYSQLTIAKLVIRVPSRPTVITRIHLSEIGKRSLYIVQATLFTINWTTPYTFDFFNGGKRPNTPVCVGGFPCPPSPNPGSHYTWILCFLWLVGPPSPEPSNWHGMNTLLLLKVVFVTFSGTCLPFPTFFFLRWKSDGALGLECPLVLCAGI